MNQSIAAIVTAEWAKFQADWEAAILENGFSLDPIFLEIDVEAAQPVKADMPSLFWWGSAAIEENTAKLTRVFDGLVRTIGQHENCLSHRGIEMTLEYLWKFRRDRRAVIAVLTLASLRARLNRQAVGYVTPRAEASDLESAMHLHNINDLAMDYLRSIDPSFKGWWPTIKRVLPNPIGDRPAPAQIAAVLAAEHVELLKAWHPVHVSAVYSEERAESIKTRGGLQSAKWYGVRREKATQRYAIERAKRLANADNRKAKWSSLSKAELETLVWTKPSRLLAIELGVSDVMISKRCRKEGIPKPARGFWWRVETGHVPHPNGRPMLATAE